MTHFIDHLADGTETVTISRAEYDSMKRSEAWLCALENAGVDNWSGISFAHELYEEEQEAS